jgi:hypothetical protein
VVENSMGPLWMPGDCDLLAALMDTLTSVHMDLGPLADREKSAASPMLRTATIAEVRKILRIAIVDLREVVIGQFHDMPGTGGSGPNAIGASNFHGWIPDAAEQGSDGRS